MTDKQKQPYYKDQQIRGGWKLHATFTTDPMGRNAMQLVCPELRSLTKEESSEFLENAKFMILYIVNDLKLDCQLLPTKLGYKHDRITMVGPTEDLIKIAQGVHAMLEIDTPAAPEWTKENMISRRSMLLQAFASKATPTLLRELGNTDPERNFSMHVQLSNVQPTLEALNARIDELDKEGRSAEVHVRTEKPLDPKMGIVQITGPMRDLVRIAMKYGDACGMNYSDLSDHLQQSAQKR